MRSPGAAKAIRARVGIPTLARIQWGLGLAAEGKCSGELCDSPDEIQASMGPLMGGVALPGADVVYSLPRRCQHLINSRNSNS